MTAPAATAILTVLSYLVGSIPFGLLVGKAFAGRDVREVGSGNIGATNVVRAAGRTAGVLTLLLDTLKAALPTWVGLHFWGLWPAMLAGAAAFLGHLFPIYLGFRGGKGVASCLGVFLVLSPVAAVIAIATYGLVFLVTHVSALGSLSSLATGGVTILVLSPRPVLVLFVALALLVVFRHRENLAKLRGART